jgi:molybdopterin converting factor small subunit
MEYINIRILFFGSLKSYFGNHLKLHVQKGLKVGSIINQLKEKTPEADKILSSCRIAVDEEVQDEEYELKKSGEIAILPPYSGG